MCNIKVFDIYSERLFFTIDKKEKFQTSTGGCFGITSIFLVICISFIIGKGFYFKLDPMILAQIKVLDKHVVRSISSYDFTIAWKIEHYNGSYFETNGSLFFNAYQEVWKEIKDDEYKLIQKKTLNSSSCNGTLFDSIDFSEIKKEKWSCIEIKGVENLTIGGKIHESDFEQTLTLSISNCPTDEYDKNICSSFKQLGKNTPYVTFLHPSIEFDYDLAYPLEMRFKSIYNNINPYISKSYDCDYNFGIFTDDIGIITQNLANDDYISINNCNLDVNLIEDRQDEREKVEYLKKKIFLSKTISENRRFCMKIQDLFAKLAGFISALNLVFQNIYHFFFLFERKKLLIDKIWIENEKSQIKSTKSNVIVENLNLKYINKDRDSLKKIHSNLKKEKKKDESKSQLNIKSFDYLNQTYKNNDNSKIIIDFENHNNAISSNREKKEYTNANIIIEKETQTKEKNYINKEHLFSHAFDFLQKKLKKENISHLRKNFKINFGYFRYIFSKLFKKTEFHNKDYMIKIIYLFDEILEEPFDAYNYLKFYYQVNYNTSDSMKY